MSKQILVLAFLSLLLAGCEGKSVDQSNDVERENTETSLQLVGSVEPSDGKCCDCSEEINSVVKTCGKGCEACEAGRPEDCECKTTDKPIKDAANSTTEKPVEP